jgi:flavoprotein
MYINRMDSKPNLYVLVPYSVRSTLMKQVETTLDSFLEQQKLDMESFNRVNELFRNILKLQDKYTRFVFQYYRLFSKIPTESTFSKSFTDLKILFQDLYITRSELTNLPIISKLTSDEYDALIQYLIKYYSSNESIIHVQKLFELTFINPEYRKQLLYDIILYSYFSLQTVENKEGLFLYGFKLSKEKQKILLSIFQLSEEKKKDILKYFKIINTLFTKIKQLYLKDIERHWSDKNDPIYTVLKTNFFNPMTTAIAQSYKTSTITKESYLNQYKVDTDIPIIHKINPEEDPVNGTIESFYQFLEMFNIVSNETNYIFRKELQNLLIRDTYTNNFKLETQLSKMKEPMLLTDNQLHKMYLLDYYDRIHKADALGLCRFVWMNGKYVYVPFPVHEKKTVKDYLLNTCLLKDPFYGIYSPRKYGDQTAEELFMSVTYKTNIQIIHSLIFQHIIVPKIEEKINII